MTPHIGARKGEIAETVLMPGDPRRAEWAARTFLTGARLVTEVRGMLGLTGTYQGQPVTIMGSGMGMASMSIYANELIRDYGARTLIRIGSCGALPDHVKVRDIVIAMAASSLSTPSRAFFHGLNFAPVADWSLLRAAVTAAEGMGLTPHVGGIHSSDTFYDERTDQQDALLRHGTLAVEMETAELYTVAARHGARALSVLTVSDHIRTGESLPASDRERSFGDMVRIALTAALTA